VVVLAAVGFLSLRRDKILAQHEAADRAQTIADSLLPRAWSTLTNSVNPENVKHHAFLIDPSGDLIFPFPFPQALSPEPLNFNSLTTEQTRLWQKAQRAETSDSNLPDA